MILTLSENVYKWFDKLHVMDKDLAQIPAKTKYGILICQPLEHFKGLAVNFRLNNKNICDVANEFAENILEKFETEKEKNKKGCSPNLLKINLKEKLKKYFNTEKNNLNNFLIKNRERILSELERNCGENILNCNAENWLFLGGTDKNESTVNCRGGIVNELNLKIEEAIERLVKKIPEDGQVRVWMFS